MVMHVGMRWHHALETSAACIIWADCLVYSPTTLVGLRARSVRVCQGGSVVHAVDEACFPDSCLLTLFRLLEPVIMLSNSFILTCLINGERTNSGILIVLGRGGQNGLWIYINNRSCFYGRLHKARQLSELSICIYISLFTCHCHAFSLLRHIYFKSAKFWVLLYILRNDLSYNDIAIIRPLCWRS